MKGFAVDHLNATVHEDIYIAFLRGLKLKKIQDRIP